MNLWEQLKRRRVVRVAGIYVGAVFVALQVADLVIEPLHLPPWTFTMLLVLAGLGFPLAMGLAWAFDVTPDGLERTESLPADVAAARAPSGARPRVFPLAGTAVVMLIAIAAAGWWVGRGAGPGSADASTADPAGVAMAQVASADRSIAVLPFANVSGNPENEYFSDGITEDILTNLALMRELRVTSRTSVMQYKGTTKSIPEIARELGVRYVLEGSVRRVGDQVRITGQLIETETDTHVWASNYDRDVSDVFAIQTEIARAIADALQAALSSIDSLRLASGPPTTSVAAYDDYLKAREAFWKLDGASRKESIRLYRQAIAKDPAFALAHAGLATAMQLELQWDMDSSYVSLAEAAAERAIELAPLRPEGYVALALISADPSQSQRLLDRALELNPNHGEAAFLNANLARSRGELARALAEGRRATELEPLNGYFHFSLAHTYRFLGMDSAAQQSFDRAGVLRTNFPHGLIGRAEIALGRGRFEEALEAALSTYEGLGPGEDPPGHSLIALAEMALGRHRPALDRLERIVRDSPEATGRFAAELGYLYVQVGDRDAAARAIEQGRRHWSNPPERGGSVDHHQLARLALLEGDTAAALAHLGNVFAQGGRYAGGIRHDPVLAPLRGRAEFQRLLTMMDSAVARERQLIQENGG